MTLLKVEIRYRWGKRYKRGVYSNDYDIGCTASAFILDKGGDPDYDYEIASVFEKKHVFGSEERRIRVAYEDARANIPQKVKELYITKKQAVYDRTALEKVQADFQTETMIIEVVD